MGVMGHGLEEFPIYDGKQAAETINNGKRTEHSTLSHVSLDSRTVVHGAFLVPLKRP